MKTKNLRFFASLFALASIAISVAHADAIGDWNRIADRTMSAAQVGGNPRARALATMHVAVFEAVNAIDRRYAPYGLKLDPAPAASIDAAVAAASHGVRVALIPAQKPRLDEALNDTLKNVTEAPARAAGVLLGERAAAAILAARTDDALSAPDTYRPHTTPGGWVPTAPPITPEYARAKPWGNAKHDTYRPGPPPALASEQYARDYNETKSLGARNSSVRTPAQTDAVRFWSQANLQASIDQVMRQYVESNKLGPAAAARAYALAYMAYLNTFIFDWDAKFTYNFWRPVTAIRNGDIDGNDATERDPAWTPLNATPMHPEYPSQAAIIAGAMRALVEFEFGTQPVAITITDTANPQLKRSFDNVGKLADEMCEVRIWGGIHFRTSLKVAQDMGRRLAIDLASGMFKASR